MSECKQCGRHDGHWLGCVPGESGPRDPARFADAEATSKLLDAEEFTAASPCAKDGCWEPRAISKGPRPAKYCETHKTRSK